VVGMGRLVAALALTALVAGVADAQTARPVAFTGRVLWVSGSKMAVSVNNQAVAVDLTSVPLDDYRALQPGTEVRVTGVPSRNGIVASAVEETAVFASPGEPLP